MLFNKVKVSFKKVRGFKCVHCHQWVPFDKFIGTHFRNHCPFCLWSKHVDEQKSGDRLTLCHGDMEPLGLTFKKEGFDKYGQPRQGELMVIHQCQDCGQISINRLAADDDPQIILKIFEESKKLGKETSEKIKAENIRLLVDKDKEEIQIQLFGKKV